MAVICGIAGLAAVSCHESARGTIQILTTPAVAGAEVPQRLAGEFTSETGIPVRLCIVAGEQIAATAKTFSGVAIFRDPNLYATLSRERSIQLKGVFAHEDFMVVGPHGDPAHVRGAPSAGEAFRRVVAHKRRFCSPVDVPSLRNVERAVWSAVGVDPHADFRYQECHGSAREVFHRSDEMQAYTLSDRLTAESSRNGHLDVLVRGVPMLRFEYVVALLGPSSSGGSRDETWFVEWVMSYRGRDVVRSMREREQRAFFVPGEP